ncbi:hypothetical protein ACI3ET_00035 [Ornithinimicrobium sp. LYQ121]|uniref:hypothetical protein n=1 Tax=Ornithinimicrobium sp. LYQ121 TaxID=3378801 RepID=UPI003853E78A
MALTFTPPQVVAGEAEHHDAAARLNEDVVTDALEALLGTVRGATAYRRILLRAAAGAGKSHALKRMVTEVLGSPHCSRVAVAASANKQLYPLAHGLGEALGKDVVCLFSAEKKLGGVPQHVWDTVTVVHKSQDVPDTARVVLSTAHRLGVPSEHDRLLARLGPAANGDTAFDVLFVDEAWQMPRYLYGRIEPVAPVAVGVGDVGQLPPIDGDANPWRGDPGYNPYRAWPDTFPADSDTWTRELPTVWRPRAEQLALWRAFYTDWQHLTCVMAPGDRAMEVLGVDDEPGEVWGAIATGVPTLLEVSGLPDPEAPDVDPDLLAVVGEIVEAALSGDLRFSSARMAEGRPTGEQGTWGLRDADGGDPAIAILATRNQQVDDAHRLVESLVEKHDLAEGVLVASTVDSWQGQTNAVTIGIHPLSGAESLDEFNSAFGRLAVVCTRATHGLLLVARSGVDELLQEAAARPGTPLGEPGVRQLPRQTHARILKAFARGSWGLPARVST